MRAVEEGAFEEDYFGSVGGYIATGSCGGIWVKDLLVAEVERWSPGTQ